MFTTRDEIPLSHDILILIPSSGRYAALLPPKAARTDSPKFANGAIANLLFISKSDFAAARQAR